MISDYDKCVLLLPMSGSNNGTTFTDYSPSPKTVTVAGNTKTVTAQSKYYGSSGYFDGTGDYLSVPLEAQINGTENFTIECWFYVSGFPVTDVDTLCSQIYSSSNGFNFELTTAGNVGFWISNNKSYRTTSQTFNTGAWNHVALVRTDNTFNCYLNGLIGFSAIVSVSFTTSVFRIGREASTNTTRDFLGYLQDFRVTKGAALYTNDFTPPGKMLGTLSNNGSGVTAILDDTGSPAVRRIFAVPRGYTGFLTGRETTSDSSGRFSLIVPRVAHNVIIEDNATGNTTYRDILISRVIPE